MLRCKDLWQTFSYCSTTGKREKAARQHRFREGLVIMKRNSDQVGWSRWELYSYRRQINVTSCNCMCP